MAVDGLQEGVLGGAVRAYKTTMRLRRAEDGGEILADVRWYRCPPGAKDLPVDTAFGSTVWDHDARVPEPEGELGELPGVRRVRDRGDPPPGVTGQGTKTPLAWFLNGVPAGVTGPYPFGPCDGAGEAFTLALGFGLTWTQGDAFRHQAGTGLGADAELYPMLPMGRRAKAGTGLGVEAERGGPPRFAAGTGLGADAEFLPVRANPILGGLTCETAAEVLPLVAWSWDPADPGHWYALEEPDPEEYSLVVMGAGLDPDRFAEILLGGVCGDTTRTPYTVHEYDPGRGGWCVTFIGGQLNEYFRPVEFFDAVFEPLVMWYELGPCNPGPVIVSPGTGLGVDSEMGPAP